MYTTVEAAKQIGVCKNSLLRWINEGFIPDVERDWRGWRTWSQEDIDRAKTFREDYHSQPIPRVRRRLVSKARYARSAAESMSRYGRALKKGAKGLL
jgi:predicted site-specific integrase-resolvase